VEAILKIHNLDIGINNNKLVNNLNLEINKGEIFAVVGESGSGKSLTALTVLNLLKYNGKFNVSGQVSFEGENILKYSDYEMEKIRGKDISMIFQDPMTSLNPLHTIGKQLEEAIKLHQNLQPYEIRNKIHRLLHITELGFLKDRLNNYPHQLSGGQRQRVMIAMALANNPQILIADEPTTALDVTVQHSILKLIRKLRDEHKLTVILITHDLTIVKNIADRVAVLRMGILKEINITSEIFSNPKDAYTKKLINAEPKGEAIKLKDHKDILTVSNLHIGYKRKIGFLGLRTGEIQVVKDVNFYLEKGQTIGIVGESGSGKTTLAKAIIRLLNSSGKIKFKEHYISKLSEAKFKPYRKKIQIVFQDPYSSLNPRMTVEEIILEGLKAHKIKADYDQLIDETLTSMNLKPEMKYRYPHQMSGGEKQRVGIARSLVLKPDLIVMDEPTSALDLLTQGEILDILKTLQREKHISFLFISHDLRVIKSISHYIIVMKDGVIVEQGDTKQIFESPKTDYTKKLIESAFLKGL